MTDVMLNRNRPGRPPKLNNTDYRGNYIITAQRKERVIKVLQEVSDGKQIIDIAKDMNRSYQGLKTLMSMYYYQNGLNNVGHAIAEGFRKGILK